MKKSKFETAEKMPGLGGGFDPLAEAEELAGLPVDGKPTYRKRFIARALEEAALGHVDNPEHSGRYASTITIYCKGVRDDEAFNAGLRNRARDHEKEDNIKDENNDDAQADTLQDEHEARAALADALYKYQH